MHPNPEPRSARVQLTDTELKALASELFWTPFRDPKTPSGGAWNGATDAILLAADRRGLLAE